MFLNTQEAYEDTWSLEFWLKQEAQSLSVAYITGFPLSHIYGGFVPLIDLKFTI